jgi:hypothetical protein
VIVRVLDPDGNVTFTSEEYYGNELSAPVHIDGLAGKTGRLSFELREAHLYAVGSSMKK